MPAGSMLQMALGLVFVLGLVALSAWLLKRFHAVPGAGPGVIRIIGGAALGQRERVVVLEVGGTWLLVGVAPGQVRALHTMPKAEFANAGGAPAEASFAPWLKRTLERYRNG